MSNPETSTKQPGRQINKRVIVGFLSLILITLLGVVFIPWDVAKPEAPDLEPDPIPPAIPAAENAFTYFEAAGKLQVKHFSARYSDGTPRDLGSLFYKVGLDGQPGWNPEFADEVLKTNAATFAELEKGLACQQYQVPPCDAKSALSWLQAHKALVQLMNVKSKREQLTGDYAGSAKTGLQGLQLGKLVTTRCNLLISWLVGISCEQMALARLEELVADAKTPEPVLREILAALDKQSSLKTNAAFKQMVKGEHLWLKKQFDDTKPDKWWELDDPKARWFSWIPYTYKPNMTLSLVTDYDRVLIANADRPLSKTCFDYPGKPTAPNTIWEKVCFYAKPNFLGNQLFLEPAFNKALSKKCQMQGYVAGLRLKIALRLYELKHGELPDTLNALVPEYLPEILKDPYDDQPFRYSKTEKKVWAVGDDLIDDGGKMKEKNAIMLYRGKGTDAVMPLEPRDPNPPPAAIPPPATTR